MVTKFIVFTYEKSVITNYEASQEEIKKQCKGYHQVKVFQSSIIRTYETFGVIHPKFKHKLLMKP